MSGLLQRALTRVVRFHFAPREYPQAWHVLERFVALQQQHFRRLIGKTHQNGRRGRPGLTNGIRQLEYHRFDTLRESVRRTGTARKRAWGHEASTAL